ncbi:hypothetical protein [Ethanoligenens harbinense]|nr:hypothetical protein [Ethanoligenens harbinense]
MAKWERVSSLITCSNPPEGRKRWTLQLIADEPVHLQVVGGISDTAV